MADSGRLSRLPGCAGSSGRLLIGQVLQKESYKYFHNIKLKDILIS